MTKDSLKQLLKQNNSSISVMGLWSLIRDIEGITATSWYYDSWGNFSNSDVTIIIDGEGYVVSRKEPHKDSSVIIGKVNKESYLYAGDKLLQEKMRNWFKERMK
ncbi:TPA: hypothetical protein ACX6S4_002208 [Photobacterium damselae]